VISARVVPAYCPTAISVPVVHASIATRPIDVAGGNRKFLEQPPYRGTQRLAWVARIRGRRRLCRRLGCRRRRRVLRRRGFAAEAQARKHLIRIHLGVHLLEHFDQGAVGGRRDLHRHFIGLELDQGFIFDDRVAHCLAPPQYGGARSFLVGRDQHVGKLEHIRFQPDL
jgi:hypothetical protein